MKQQALTGFEKYGKTTRRARFLAEMERLVPWSELCAVIEPGVPKGGSRWWPANDTVGADVAGVLSAAVVHPVGPSGGKSAV